MKEAIILEEAGRRKAVELLSIRAAALGSMPINPKDKFDSLTKVLENSADIQFPWIDSGPAGNSSQISKDIQNIIDNYDDIIKQANGRGKDENEEEE